MPVLRDIVARLGMDYDPKGFKKADKSVKGLTSGLSGMAVALGAVAVALGGLKLLNLAGSAQETLNKLDVAFKGNADSVSKWAATFADKAGRSEFKMREMASSLGVVLNPLMEMNAEAAASMSVALAEAAVDMGSLMELADDDVLTKFLGGITGETEGLKRLGIVMTQDALAAFMLEKGIKGTFKSLSTAEKTAVRTEFILKGAGLAMGDAAKTADGWANASKGLSAGLLDLGTNIGLTMLPAAEKVLVWVRDTVKGFSELVKSTDIVKAALIVLGSVALVAGAKMLIPFLPAIGVFLLLAAGVAVAILVVEDFIGLFSGKKSAIGHFIDQIFGPGSAAEAVANLKLAFEGAQLYLENEFFPAIEQLGNMISEVWNGLSKQWSDGITELQKFGKEIGLIIDDIAEFLKTVWGFSAKVRGIVGKAADFIFAPEHGEAEEGHSPFAGVSNAADAAEKQRAEDKANAPDADGYTGVSKWFNANFGSGDNAHMAGVERERSGRQSAASAIFRKTPKGEKPSRQVISEVSEKLEINVSGLSDKKAIALLKREGEKMLKNQSKKTLKAVKQGAE